MRPTQKGFSLLELLVAFAIMALSLGALYRASGGTVRGSLTAEHQGRATWLAASLLEAHEVVLPQGIEESGESAGIRWSLRSAPYAQAPAGPGVVGLHQIWVHLAWDDGGRPQTLELSTLRPERGPVAGSRAR